MFTETAYRCFYIVQRHSIETAATPRPMKQQNDYSNHLASETSPYLLQHAGNPVEWYPWGNAAFEKARRENKPLFISIGYFGHFGDGSTKKENIKMVLVLFYLPIKVKRLLLEFYHLWQSRICQMNYLKLSLLLMAKKMIQKIL